MFQEYGASAIPVQMYPSVWEIRLDFFHVRLAVLNTPCEFFAFEISSFNDLDNILLGDIRIQLEFPSVGNFFF